MFGGEFCWVKGSAHRALTDASGSGTKMGKLGLTLQQADRSTVRNTTGEEASGGNLRM